MVLVMQPAIKGSPAFKGFKVGDTVRFADGSTVTVKTALKVGDKVVSPHGLVLTVNTFNIAVLQRTVDAGWPTPPPPPPPPAGVRKAVRTTFRKSQLNPQS